MTPRLAKSYKGRFPFRLGTTSYIYPAGYVANIERLGPWLDEIELLFFESRPDSWPSAAELRAMAALARRFDLSYNVHLPLDLQLGHASGKIRNAAVETVLRLFERTAPLSPTTWTLHVPMTAAPSDQPALERWRRASLDSLLRLAAAGVPARAVSLENLDYPIEWVHEFARQTGHRMCLDVGHLLVGGGDAAAAYARFKDKIDVIHLHGVRSGKDHLSLAAFAPRDHSWIAGMLENFTGSVSLEVFSLQRLLRSLDFLEKLWEKAG